MRWVRRIALLATLLASPAAAASLEAYGRLPAIEDVALSPDGATLAMVVTDGEARNILFRDVATGAAQKLLRAGTIKVRDLRWAGPQSLIITTSVTGGVRGVMAPRSEWLLSQIYQLPTGKTQPLVALDRTLNVVGAPPAIRVVDGKPAAFATVYHFVEGQAASMAGLAQVDVATGHGRLLEQGRSDTREWVVGPDGQPMAQALRDRTTGQWTLMVKDARNWREVPVKDSGDGVPDLIGLGRTPDSILVAVPQEDGAVLREYAVGTGVWSDPLPVKDANDLFYDPATHRLVGAHVLHGDEEETVFFDPGDERVWRSVAEAFAGARVSLVSASADRRRFVVLVDIPERGPAYSLIDMDARKADWIGARYQGLEGGGLSPVRPLRFKAADGLPLSGYLTLPNGREAKNLPLIVFPHGGPAARDTPGFDWWAQAMASRGYAILQVNYRGSVGFGPKFMEAGFGEWGRKMQTDLSDGVAHLAKEGLIDPKRVCIVGASYGGYAAMAGAALQDGVYRCAVSVAGVSDLKRMVAWTGGQYGRAAQRYWTRFMGAQNGRDSVLLEVSPAAHADRVKIPLLLIHGKDDTVVPIEQSETMAQAMKRAGKPVEFIVEPGEDHWLTRGATRLSMLQATTAFVEKHNPPQ